MAPPSLKGFRLDVNLFTMPYVYAFIFAPYSLKSQERNFIDNHLKDVYLYKFPDAPLQEVVFAENIGY